LFRRNRCRSLFAPRHWYDISKKVKLTTGSLYRKFSV
jgi:hypothetical protein